MFIENTLSFMETNTAYISVGSNLGDKRGFCLAAIDELDQLEGISVEKRSSLYRSEPIGAPDQDWYVNAVVRIQTSLSPQELLAALHLIEMQHLRQRTEHWGPRTLDLDILFYNELVLNDNNLSIPHPEAHKRHFVLLPLAEIAPRFVHPKLQKTITFLLRTLENKTECFPLAVNA